MSDEKTEGREAVVVCVDDSGIRVAIPNEEGGVIFGHMKRPEDGVPLPVGSDLVRVEADAERGAPHVRLHTIYESPDKPRVPRKGPGQKVTPAYSEGWDRIWGQRPSKEIN